ncbi:Hypothetical protein, putative [Bodo saltans]|uniref:Uncharacterized protein n=1 Tax=Bodo saltans TaxID=75058 RepID=A0A0S4IVT8_BODSA|nr:Hypothetical protein, putative [Bodo saltans]|eukprot:CUF65159.1 Hypothetical protein, putative [Bodo saltans]
MFSLFDCETKKMRRDSRRIGSNHSDAMSALSGGTATTATTHAPDNLPNNVYADRAPAVSLVKHVSETERARIQWAWMADSRGDATKKAVQGIDRSLVRPELLDVVRMMSSCTIETQTVEPSYIMRMNNVKMETERHRSIATQIGAPREKSSKAAQVVEADIVRSSQRGLQLYSMEEHAMMSSPGRDGGGGGARGMDSVTSPMRHGRMVDARDERGYLLGEVSDDANLHSQYRPNCDIPYTACLATSCAMNNVKMETERHRSIATQIGAPREKSSKAAQVVEADIVRSSQRGLQLYSMEEHAMMSSPGRDGGGGGARGMDSVTSPMRHGRMVDARDERGYLLGEVSDDANLHSQYRPNCDIPYTAYPVFMPDARAQGVANRYGYISLPQQIVPLPPRRRKKFIAPADVPYLYGSHDLVLDDRTTTHLQRAHSLWRVRRPKHGKY